LINKLGNLVYVYVYKFLNPNIKKFSFFIKSYQQSIFIKTVAKPEPYI